MRYAFALASAAALTSVASAKDVPQNLQDLISSVTKQGQCNDVLASPFHSEDGDANDTVYCGDHLDDYGIIYLQGTGGALSNMDIDCDGEHGVGDDGSCDGSGDTQSQTNFGENIAQWAPDISELNPYVHTYTVFGNQGSNDDQSSNVPGYTVFLPDQHGIQPLSIMAVVCNNQLFYGVWGDENGDEDNTALVGEASISLAKMCCPQDNPNADMGCNGNDVMYIAFTGDDAVPGAAADWDAQTAEDFEASLQSLGDTLVQRIGTSGSAPPTTTSASPPSSTPTGGSCSWAGHCEGATCSTDDDCSDALACNSGTCS